MMYSSNSFEAFLRNCMDQGHTQIKLVPRFHEPTGRIAFYAVGQCGPVSSETFEAVVEGEHVQRVVDLSVEELAVEEFSDEDFPPETEVPTVSNIPYAETRVAAEEAEEVKAVEDME